jgi:Reductase C-terminal
LSAREQLITRGQMGIKGFMRFFFADGTLNAFLSVNRPFSEIKIAKAILEGRRGLEELRSISDESRNLDDFLSRDPTLDRGHT